MVNFFTNVGKEWWTNNNVDGATVKIALFDQTADNLTEASDLVDMTNEANGGAYAQQSVAVSTLQIGSDFGFDNDAQVVFDTSDSTNSVDHGAVIVNFQSSVAGDGTPTDHIVAVGPLSQTRDLSSVDEVTLAAGDIDVYLAN